MPYHFEILSLGGDFYKEICEAAQILNAVQEEFHFAAAPPPLRREGLLWVQRDYLTTDIWAFLRDYRAKAKGHRPYIIAVIDRTLSSTKWTNLFGSHLAKEGFAVITLRDHHFYADSHRPFLCYYFIRYALSFIAPSLKSHNETRDCFFDFKVKKHDLEKSMASGSICEACTQELAANLNPEMQAALQKMIGVMKAQHKKSTEELPAKTLQRSTHVGILTIREDEFTAVLDRFRDEETRHARGRNGRFYEHVRLTTQKGKEIGVAIARLPERGQGLAQVVANDMIEDLSPKWILLVGIAGGFPDSDWTLGDVIISSRLQDFAVGAILDADTTEFNQLGGPLPIEAEALVTHLAAMRQELGDWNTPGKIGMAKPREEVPDAPDSRFYGSDEWRDKVLESLQHHFPADRAPRDPVCRVAPMISSNFLIKNAALAAQWRQSARLAAAFEMELTGLFNAARYGGSGKTLFFAIRGLSDIVGFKRSPEWTEFACRVAASCADTIIRSGVLIRD
jgi:nucleoside phosphorylase